MVAGLIARELGTEVYQVDLSKLASKWIGETEKNLATLFDAAESGHAILLFDEADAVFGDAWRDGKAEVLVEQGAQAYVGDHVHDMDAARLAGVIGVGVTTGPSSADELRDAGASVVLSSLEDFPGWLALQTM